MDRYFIEGRTPLKGEVRISGSKNATLPIMAAALLTRYRCTIDNAPLIQDIETMGAILRHLGCSVECDRAERQLVIEAASVSRFNVPLELASPIRASFLVAGPLLARFGQAVFPPPGGDVIGRRPVQVTLDGFESLGARVHPGTPDYTALADRLSGAELYLDYPAHTGTENLLMAACLARGRTTIANACPEPEVSDLADFLRQMGAKIKGDSTPYITIDGRERLYGAGHQVIPDRIEAGTFAIAAAITGGDVLLRDVTVDHMTPLTHKLRQAGVEVITDEQNHTYRVRGRGPLKAVEVQTLPYPGFPTDLQSSFTTLLTQASGVGDVRERVYESRFGYVAQLRRLGARIMVGDGIENLSCDGVKGQTARVEGPTALRGTTVLAEDIRAGAALILAGLAAEGTTVIEDRGQHIRRGYEKIESKLASLGANIRRETLED